VALPSRTLHKGYETAIYLLKGRADTRYGEQLENSVTCEAGDFIYIKTDVPHQPINLSVNQNCKDTESEEDGHNAC
jgi:uncharacterized RmlC-like cupin family protein